ncbi:MAG: hypothetical protein ACKVUS_21840 [Saprospiraceae bacterium]
MDRHYELIPEDGAIRALVLALGFPKPNIGDGIGNTLNKIEHHFKNRFAVGIVDDDRRKPKLFDSYEMLLKEQDFLHLKQKPSTRHFLIVVQPAIEVWLLQNAEKKEVVSPFSALKDLQRITKDEVAVAKNQRFKQFLNDLNQAKAPGFVTMTEWIEELYDKHF